MNSLRILLVEGDERRADRLLSLLASSEHSPIAVPDLGEAAEALSIQRFDLILLGSGLSVDDSAGFVARLRDLEAGQRLDSRAAVFACSPSLGGAPFLDGSLPQEFDPQALPGAVSRSQPGGQGTATPVEPPATAFAVFEPDEFEEQCASETGLMVEIIDLFSAERDRELPEMAQALAEADFGRIARLAHTIKGSLGALHAPLARRRASSLEMAAKDRNSRLCANALEALDHDLAELSGLLSSFRRACLCR